MLRRAIIPAVFALTAVGVAGTADATTSPHKASTITGCKTISDDYPTYDLAGFRLASFTMHTYFCYTANLPLGTGGRVTYHNTWPSVNITALGAAGGWVYDGLVTDQFHCFTADGSHDPCSGNYEVEQAHFHSCVVRIGCVASWYPTIEEDEFFTGSWQTYEDGVLTHQG